jgi:hypothetical protein
MLGVVIVVFLRVQTASHLPTFAKTTDQLRQRN